MNKKEISNLLKGLDEKCCLVICQQQYKLSESFIREFSDKVDWYSVSLYQKLSEEFIREFSNKVDWPCVSWKQTLSEEFIKEFSDKVDWCYVSCHQKLSEDFIQDFSDRVNWFNICCDQNRKLSNKFFRKNSNKICWKDISIYKKDLSEGFILEFYDKVDWEILDRHHRIDENIFEKMNRGQKLFMVMNYRKVWEKHKGG